MLILRTCNSDLTSYKGFQYPSSGMVECPDWDPKKECGNGLHGFAWGEGDSGLLYREPSAKWMILKVEDKDVIDLDGKVKFPRGEVVFVGDQIEATQYLYHNGGRGYKIIGLKMMGGDHSTLIGGDKSTLIGGNYSTLIGGYNSTLTGRDNSTLTGGYKSTLTGGKYSVLSWKVWEGNRYRIHTFYVGENGVEVGKEYELSDLKK